MKAAITLLLAFSLWAQTDDCEARKSARDINVRASKLFELKEWAKAAALLEQIRAVPDLPEAKADRTHALYNLACAYALLGRTEQAAEAFRESARGEMNWDLALRDSRLDSIRDDPEFRKLLEAGRQRVQWRRAFWNSPALKTSYVPNMPDDEKIAGLSKFWAEARYNFAFFDRLPGLDWDALYLEYIPKVRKTGSTLEYYQLLQEFCARLKDGHTNVWMPQEISASARPPLRMRLLEGKVVVTEVVGDPAGVTAGMEIVAIDGVPVMEYGARRIAPYQSASTPQDLDSRTYERWLLSGPRDSEVELTLRDPAGAETRRKLARTTGWAKPAPEFQLELLRGNVAHVVLNTFGNNRPAEAFDAAFDQISNANAIVFDVRENGGGNSGVGWRILGYLTDKPFAASRAQTRLYRPAMRAWGTLEEWHDFGPHTLHPHGNKLYTKPVVVLTSARTYSAAEDFAVVFHGMERGTIIGEPTGGSTGQPLDFFLPGGGGARVCTKRDTYPDGKDFVGIGVQPSVLVKPTVADFRAGRDTVLEAALDYLTKK